MRSLSNLEMARLWLHLARGKHLLVAVDPDNVATSRAGFAGSGLNRLLDLDYGLSLGRAAMLESWFTLDQLNDVLNVWSNAEAENFCSASDCRAAGAF